MDFQFDNDFTDTSPAARLRNAKSGDESETGRVIVHIKNVLRNIGPGGCTVGNVSILVGRKNKISVRLLDAVAVRTSKDWTLRSVVAGIGLGAHQLKFELTIQHPIDGTSLKRVLRRRRTTLIPGTFSVDSAIKLQGSEVGRCDALD